MPNTIPGRRLDRAAVYALTDRRREVLFLVVDGLTNQQIAKQLFLSTNTVKTHVRNLLRALGVRSRTELVIASYQAGLVPCGRCRHAMGVPRG